MSPAAAVSAHDRGRLDVYRIAKGQLQSADQRQIPRPRGRVASSARIIQMLGVRTSDVLGVGTVLGSSRRFLGALLNQRVRFVALLKPTTRLPQLNVGKRHQIAIRPNDLQPLPAMQYATVRNPASETIVDYGLAFLGTVIYAGQSLRLYVIQKGKVRGASRDLQFVLTSRSGLRGRDLIEAVLWVKLANRILARRNRCAATAVSKDWALPSLKLEPRMNLQHAAIQDNALSLQRTSHATVRRENRPGKRESAALVRNVVELFAGAGGLGLGFLLSRATHARYRIICSAELDNVYVETLRRNQARFASHGQNEPRNLVLPDGVRAIDLQSTRAARILSDQVRQYGDIDVLIGGPPCQGFSTANCNNRVADNPNNALVETFAKYVSLFRPRVFIMENVQGILWAQHLDAKEGGKGLVASIERRLKRLGYVCYPKMLDAVWYGVPQFRTRFFLVGIRKDLGYSESDFGEWGPFPMPTHGPHRQRPYVTVHDAIADLPIIGNGCHVPVQKYSPRSDIMGEFLSVMRDGCHGPVIVDHVTSKHNDYVLERFRRIPQGGNWQSIVSSLTNYTNVTRTHSNIYRRLLWHEPSITIGHYRKSMLVHPEQHRGLSLREACRLQSFPDWFEFTGSLNPSHPGLGSKQQQLANAVAPLLARALAEFIATV